MKTYYDILGVDKSASTNDIKIAYRRLIAKYHPDKGTYDKQAVLALNHAYQVLKDPKKRQSYDQTLHSNDFGQQVWRFFDKAQSTFLQNFKDNFKDNIEFLKNLKNPANDDFDDHIEVAVFPWQAIFGDKVPIQTAFHRLLVPMPAFGDCLSLVIKGAGKPKGDGSFGDLLIDFFIKVPALSDLNNEQKELWQRLKTTSKTN